MVTALICLVAAAVEGWYASGFGVLDRKFQYFTTETVVVSWAFASALFAASAILLVYAAFCGKSFECKNPCQNMNLAGCLGCSVSCQTGPGACHLICKRITENSNYKPLQNESCYI